ncbi:hypothetical protein HDV06_006622 [Boothiomyces sp. JEL0866]|nr:hypothetical protein HDV06_006622 [Boothiomyces sp. JEL0866]
MDSDEENAVDEVPAQEAMTNFKIDKKTLKKMEILSEQIFKEDIQQVMQAVNLFLDSKVLQAEKLLEDNYTNSLLHVHGAGVLAVLKALMTFDNADIDKAMQLCKNTMEISAALRKEQSMISSFSGMIFGGAQKNKINLLKSMNKTQRHAEITYAESYLLKALLSIVTDSNLVTFLKEGLAIKQAFGIFKSCYKFLVKIIKEEGQAGLIKNGIDNHFITSVYFGIGNFNLILSMLPAKLLRVFEFIGFGGNRDLGLKCLELGAQWPQKVPPPHTYTGNKKVAISLFSEELPPETEPGTRRFMCDLVLLSYHVVISTMMQLHGCNLPLAASMISRNIQQHPNSFMYLIIKGKQLQCERNLAEASDVFNRVVGIQSDWRPLAHICFWELGICQAGLGNWAKAANYFEILFKENKWSKAIYLYLKAICMYAADKVKNKEHVSEMLKDVPNHLKKKFVARKSRKYFIQNERLLFPEYEIFYMWNGFDLLPKERLEVITKELDQELINLDKVQEKYKSENPGNELPYPTFYDDLCLVRFFKGLATKDSVMASWNMYVPETELLAQKLTPEQEKTLTFASKQIEFISLQADEIEYDHWILPFSRYELGLMYFRLGDYDRAKAEYQAALNGGYGEDEAGKQKRKASMESSLHMRLHNAMMKLKLVQSIAEKKEVEIEDDEHDSGEED